MRITQHLADAAVLSELGQRLEGYRLRRNWTQQALAREAGISKRTVERIEAGRSAQWTSIIRVLRALELLDRLEAGLPAPPPSPIEQLRRQGKQRLRASGAHASDSSDSEDGTPWRWGDDD